MQLVFVIVDVIIYQDAYISMKSTYYFYRLELKQTYVATKNVQKMISQINRTINLKTTE